MTSADVFSLLILFNEQAIKSSLLALSGPNIPVLIHPHAIQEKKKKTYISRCKRDQMLKARISLTKDLSRNYAMHEKSYKWRWDNLYLRFQNINPPIKNKVGDVYNTLPPLTFHPPSGMDKAHICLIVHYHWPLPNCLHPSPCIFLKIITDTGYVNSTSTGTINVWLILHLESNKKCMNLILCDQEC